MSNENEASLAKENDSNHAPFNADSLDSPKGEITFDRLGGLAGLREVSADEIGRVRSAVEGRTAELIQVPDVLTEFVTALESMPGVDEQEKLRRLVDASFGPGIDCVREQLVSRFESYNGVPLTRNQIELAVSGFSEVFEHPEGDALSIDLGAFALFGQKASIEQNIAVQRAQEKIINDFESRYGLMVLKSRAGDCYVPFIPRIYARTENRPDRDVERMLVLTQALAKAMGQIEMPVEAIKNALGKDGQPLYEIRSVMERGVQVEKAYFKVTVAVADAAEGKVQHALTLSSVGGAQGLFRLRGETLAEILRIENKRGVTKGHARFDEASLARIQQYYPSLSVVDGQIHLMGEDISFSAKPGFTLSDDRVETALRSSKPAGPVTNAEFLAALVALQATTTTGAPQRFAQRCVQTEYNNALSSEPGRVALGVQVGSAQDEAENPEKYDAFYDELIALVSEPRFTNRFQLLKHDESWVVISSRGNGVALDLSNEQDLKLLLVLQIALGSLLKKHELTAKVASSAGSSRFSIPSPGLVAEDWYWEDVVNLARLLKGTDFEGILVHSNVCMKAAGTLGFLEFLSQEFKGIGLVQFLRLYPDMEVDDVLSQIMSQDLLGVDGVRDTLQERLNNPVGHGVISLMGPVHDPEGRYGKSALMRRFALGQKQIIGPKLQPVMLSGVNTLGKIMDAIGYAYEGTVVMAYEKMLHENPNFLDGHLLLCDPSVELDETTKNLLRRTGDVMKGRIALLIWAGAEEGEVLRLSPLSLDDATTLVSRTKGIPETDTTTISLLRAELGKLETGLISRLTPPFVLHQLSAAIEIKRNSKTGEIDSIILHRDRLSTTGTGSSALETQAEALSLDTDVRGVYGLIASLRAPLSRESLISLVVATLGLSEARAAFAVGRLLEVTWISDEGGALSLTNESHRDGAMNLHSYDFRGAVFADAGLTYFPSDKPIDSMTLDEQYTELGLRLQAESLDVTRLRELTAVIALEYYKSGQIAESRSVYHRYFEKVGETNVPLGLDEKGVGFYLNAATVLRQGASSVDHQVAIDLLKFLVGYRGIADLQRQKVFFALSRMVNKGLDLTDECGVMRSNLGEIPFVEDRKESLLSHPAIQSLLSQREICGKLKTLLLSFPAVSDVEARHLNSMNVLIYDLTITYLEARFLPYIDPSQAAEYRAYLSQKTERFKAEYVRLKGLGASDCAPEMFATATRLFGGLLLKMDDSEGEALLKSSRQAYLDLDVPDYKQANDVTTGLLKSEEQYLLGLVQLRGVQTDAPKSKTAVMHHSSEVFEKAQSLLKSLNQSVDACRSSGDIENWHQSLSMMHNVYLVLIFAQASVAQSTAYFVNVARKNVEEIASLLSRKGTAEQEVSRIVNDAEEWIDLVSR